MTQLTIFMINLRSRGRYNTFCVLDVSSTYSVLNWTSRVARSRCVHLGRADWSHCDERSHEMARWSIAGGVRRGGNLDAVAAVRLGDVERAVGGAFQTGGVGGVVG